MAPSFDSRIGCDFGAQGDSFIFVRYRIRFSELISESLLPCLYLLLPLNTNWSVWIYLCVRPVGNHTGHETPYFYIFLPSLLAFVVRHYFCPSSFYPVVRHYNHWVQVVVASLYRHPCMPSTNCPSLPNPQGASPQAGSMRQVSRGPTVLSFKRR